MDTPVQHWAFRLEDRLHERREKRARKRGRVPGIISYVGYGAPGWVRMLGRVLYVKPEIAQEASDENTERPEQSAESIRGWRSFTSVPVSDIDVRVTVEGVDSVLRSDHGGVIDAVIQVELTPGWHTATMQCLDAEGAPSGPEVAASIMIVDPDAEYGLLSDVDDTVMVTALPRPFVAAWNSFVLDEHARIPTPGMAVFYDRALREGNYGPVFYLSTGAWNVAPTLTRFLSRNLFPRGAMLLTDWGPTHDRMFRSGREHKTSSLARLAEEFPRVKWLLVGDDGQHDVAIYREFQEAHPQNVAAVAIRQLSTSESVMVGRFRGQKAKQPRTEMVDGVRWVYAPDGSGMASQLDL